MRKACENCAFRVSDRAGYGICHRYPPASILNAKADMMSQFPLVKDGWWCGEWKPEEKEDPDAPTETPLRQLFQSENPVPSARTGG